VADLSFWEQQIAIGSEGLRKWLQLVALKDGTFVAVWEQTAAGDTDIMAQVYHADGTPKSGVIQVNSLDMRDDGTPSIQVEPVVTALASGGFAVAWTDSSSATQGNNVRGRIFNAAGIADKEDFLATVTSSGSQHTPQIAAYGNGFVLIARDNDPSRGVEAISTTILDATGTALKEVRSVGVFTSYSVASVTGDPNAIYDGMFVVATLADRLIGDKISLNVYNRTELYNSWDIDVGLNARDVSVTALANGRFVVVWKEVQGTEPTNYLIKAVIYDSDGDDSAIKTLAQAQDNKIEKPVVAALPNGGFALAYAIDGDIQAQTYDHNGDNPGGFAYVHEDRAGEQSAPTNHGFARRALHRGLDRRHRIDHSRPDHGQP
jgi:hypothetical protein